MFPGKDGLLCASLKTVGFIIFNFCDSISFYLYFSWLSYEEIKSSRNLTDFLGSYQRSFSLFITEEEHQAPRVTWPIHGRGGSTKLQGPLSLFMAEEGGPCSRNTKLQGLLGLVITEKEHQAPRVYSWQRKSTKLQGSLGLYMAEKGAPSSKGHLVYSRQRRNVKLQGFLTWKWDRIHFRSLPHPT